MQKGRYFFKFLTKTEKRKAERFSKSCYVQQGENTGEKMLCVCTYSIYRTVRVLEITRFLAIMRLRSQRDP
jgi:hypothetical protein